MNILIGKWIVEVAELSALNKSDKNRIKSYITLTYEQHRIPYERQSKTYPRQFVLIGTTNNECILDDPTGERRFPIVECAEADKKDTIKKRILWDNDEKYNEIKYDIQQILAEIYQEYKDGKKFLKVPKEFEDKLKNVQTKYFVEDSDEGIIEEFLDGKKETCLLQIWKEALGHTQPRDKASRADKERITNILCKMPNWQLYDGNEQHKKRISGQEYDRFKEIYKEISYGPQKAWVYVEPQEPENGNDYVDPSLKKKIDRGEQLTYEDYDKAFDKF